MEQVSVTTKHVDGVFAAFLCSYFEVQRQLGCSGGASESKLPRKSDKNGVYFVTKSQYLLALTLRA